MQKTRLLMVADASDSRSEYPLLHLMSYTKPMSKVYK